MLIQTRKTWLGLGALAICAFALIAGAQQALADASQQMRTIQENNLVAPDRAAQPSPGTLIAGLGSQDWQQRRQAAYRLGELGSKEAVTGLIAILKAEDDVLRRIAAKSLGKIGDPRAVSVLNALMQDVQAPIAVRCAAACALGMIGGQQAQEALSCACNQLEEGKNIQQRRLQREISRAKEASNRLDG